MSLKWKNNGTSGNGLRVRESTHRAAEFRQNQPLATPSMIRKPRSSAKDVGWLRSEDIVAEVAVQHDSEPVRRPKTIADDRQRGGQEVGPDNDLVIGLD